MKLTVSIKGVLWLNENVLLAKNSRTEWELPGGQLEREESPEETCQREFLEETGLQVVATNPPLLSETFEVIPDRHVFIVAYHCQTKNLTKTPQVSNEHSQLETFSKTAALNLSNLPQIYKRAISYSSNLILSQKIQT